MIPMYAPCPDCGRDMVPNRLWIGVDAATRAEWKRKGKARAAAAGRCQGCYAKRSYVPKPRVPKPEKPAILEEPCKGCGASLVRAWQWQKATAEKRQEWTKAGHQRERQGNTCYPCITKAAAEKREAEREALAARVVELREAGLTIKEVAAELGISKATVERHSRSRMPQPESPAILQDGAWVPRGGILVWQEAS